MPSRQVDFTLLVTQLDNEFRAAFRETLTGDNQSYSDRIRRCLSWLRRASEISTEDRPPKFVDLWISSNALYGQQHYKEESFKGELADFRSYLDRMTAIRDAKKTLLQWVQRKHVQGRIRDL